MKPMRLLMVAVSLCVTLTGSPSFGLESYNRAALDNLDQVKVDTPVIVETYRSMIDPDRVRQIIEIGLMRAGVKIASPETSCPFVHPNISIQVAFNTASWQLNLNLRDFVIRSEEALKLSGDDRSRRDQILGSSLIATTWETAVFEYADLPYAANTFYNSVQAATDALVRDILLARQNQAK